MTFKIETHAHTSEVSPCALVPAETVVYHHAEAGYKGLCITDHFNSHTLGSGAPRRRAERFLAGYRKAAGAAERAGIALYLGAELKFDGPAPCEYLLFGLHPEMIGDLIPLLRGGVKELFGYAERSALALFQAHPFRRGQSPALPMYLHGIETHNGNPRHRSRNDLALQFAHHNGLRELSGSDYHQSDDIGRGGILAPTLPKDGAGLARLLLQGEYTLPDFRQGDDGI